jgi:hypothetical protein
MCDTAGVALLAQVQPKGEGNRALKKCAQCEVHDASSFCTKCRVTPYCSRDCQLAHWKATHSKTCKLDPLVAAMSRPDLVLPSYRPYTDEEATFTAVFWTLLPGTCQSPPTDRRDALCQLVQPANEAFGVHADADRRLKAVPAAAARAMGWVSGCAASDVATGYSLEDREVLRVYYGTELPAGDDAAAPPLENLVAHSVLFAPRHHGAFVVAKVRREEVAAGAYEAAAGVGVGEEVDDEGKPQVHSPYREFFVPFSKNELVDLCAWRGFCGSSGPAGLGGLHSSRVFRENMRRKEMEGFLQSQGFQHGSFQNTHFHGGI